jgi:hypothetical protein
MILSRDRGLGFANPIRFVAADKVDSYRSQVPYGGPSLFCMFR